MKITLDLFLRRSSGLTSEVNRQDDLMELLSKLILVPLGMLSCGGGTACRKNSIVYGLIKKGLMPQLSAVQYLVPLALKPPIPKV